MNIENFYDPDDSMVYLSRPFNLNGRTVACNGHIFVSMPRQGDYLLCPNEYLPKFLLLIEKSQQSGFVSLPEDLVFPAQQKCGYCLGTGKCTRTKCLECNGEGEISWNSGFNEYDHECKSCQGDGEIRKVGGDSTCFNCGGTGKAYDRDSKVKVFELWINPTYLGYIIDEPGLKIAINVIENKLAFKSETNFGLIMGMNI